MAHSAVFPPHDHDHHRCAADALAHAEAQCAARGERLTPIRRQVLEALLASHQPMGAYDVIEKVAETHKRPAPITIYRALDFLKEQGLVHRIESRNAFLACAGGHADDAMLAFFICDACGAAGEASLPGLRQLIDAAADKAGFQAAMPVVEIAGLCANCRARGAKPAK